MEQLLDRIERVTISDGVIHANTWSCGCCSDTLSSDENEYGYSEKINTRLVTDYVTRELKHLSKLLDKVKEIEYNVHG
tara:strand:+ start:1955 stop:2188 length:234 start_codon:yes stop_codon:yes gene_type:complete